MNVNWFFWRQQTHDFEIDGFQLANIIENHLPFLYFDLRKNLDTSALTSSIAKLLKPAQPLSASMAVQHLREHIPSSEFPVILICEKGKTSTKVACQLIEQGYINIYVVKGGLKALCAGEKKEN